MPYVVTFFWIDGRRVLKVDGGVLDRVCLLTAYSGNVLDWLYGIYCYGKQGEKRIEAQSIYGCTCT